MKKKAVCYRITSEVKKALDIRASELGLAKSALVDAALRKFLKMARRAA